MSNLDGIEINDGELPRPGSVMFNFHFKDEKDRKITLKRWQKMNKYLMVPLYRVKLLPLLGFGKIFLILKTKGWKTGKLRRTPLEYRRYNDTITIFASRGEESTWVKNMRANPENVSVIHGFHHFKPRIEYIEDSNQKLTIMKWYVERFGKAAKMLFGWDPKTDDPDIVDFTKLINLITIILLHKGNK
ncbi:MAG: nitroreductase/quinone reductase family protein [Candidatus Lokiarchaeota archaeon]